MDEIKISKDEERVFLTNSTKQSLKSEQNKSINMYYRCEGTFIFSLISLLLCIFLWDDISDPLFYMLFTVILNLLLMGFFMFRHLKEKKLI